MSAALPILLALFNFAPKIPSPNASQLLPILSSLRVFQKFFATSPLSFDLIASLLIVPTYLTLARKGLGSGWTTSNALSVFLVLLNTYLRIRTLLLERPYNIFEDIPFSTSSTDLLAIFPPGSGNQALDELLIRFANIETKKSYIRYGHDTMINVPTLASETIIYVTYLAMQLPSYIFTAGIFAILSSSLTPAKPQTNRRSRFSLSSKSTAKAWLMISLFLMFGVEVYWTTNTPIEALSVGRIKSYFSKNPKVGIQPPIYEISRTIRTILFTLYVPFVQYLLFGPPPPAQPLADRITFRQTDTEANFRQLLESSGATLNQTIRKLHHLHSLQRVATTQPKMAAKWMGESSFIFRSVSLRYPYV